MNLRPEEQELIARFQQSVDNATPAFFDKEELESIIDIYFQHERLQLAQQAISYALALYPSHPYFSQIRAKLFFLQSDYQQAASLIESLPAPLDTHVRLIQVLSLIFLGQTDRPRTLSEELILDCGIDDDTEDIIYSVVSAYYEHQHYAEAQHFISIGLSIHPHSIDMMLFYAEILIALGLPQQAISQYNAINRIDATIFASWARLGQLLLFQYQNSAKTASNEAKPQSVIHAVEALQYADALYDPKSDSEEDMLDSLRALLDSLVILHDYDSYIATVLSHRQLLLSTEATLHNIGQILQSLNRWDEAREIYLSAIPYNKENFSIWVGLSQYYEHIGDSPALISHLSDLYRTTRSRHCLLILAHEETAMARINPDNDDILINAYRHLKRYLTLDPDNITALFDLGCWNFIMCKYRAAINQFKQVRRLYPDHPRIDIFIALAYHGLHMPTHVGPHITAALQKEPDASDFFLSIFPEAVHCYAELNIK